MCFSNVPLLTVGFVTLNHIYIVRLDLKFKVLFICHLKPGPSITFTYLTYEHFRHCFAHEVMKMFASLWFNKLIWLYSFMGHLVNLVITDIKQLGYCDTFNNIMPWSWEWELFIQCLNNLGHSSPTIATAI